jgi:hypothetical protein
MTESEWLACTNPDEMREKVFGPGRNRKFRLLACAYCRRIWEWLAPQFREAVEIAERYADGQATNNSLAAARTTLESFRQSALDEELKGAAYPVENATWDIMEGRDAVWGAWDTARAADWNVAYFLAMKGEPPGGYPNNQAYEAAHTSFRAENAALLRDVFDNPFRPAVFDPAWRTQPVVHLARSIYVTRGFFRMLELADALEQSGCTNQDVLQHCRHQGEHVKGCWLVDLILGKT